MLAEKYLTELGFTMEQAQEFITLNVNQPEVIYNTAAQYGVNNRMLSEISGFSRNIVTDYFKNAGFISPELDRCILINYDLGALENLVAFNTREGILSNAALCDIVKPAVNKNYDYDSPFTPPNPKLQSSDSIYSSGELGVERIDNVPITNENVESLFYGTLINMFLALEQSELDQINAFSDTGNSEDFQTLLLGALNDIPESTSWSDEQLAELVTDEAIHIMDEFWNANLYGILDHSYLGLATS
ncbi:MAG: hypothetical protein LZF61_02175 [Nitrosomonas sp.]|nr:MAG: hypothetical protein LZF61_02175 [Nitrosomonas sp.]